MPDYIQKPSYYTTGIPADGPKSPEIKSKDQIDKMRASCRLAANILKKVEDIIEVNLPVYAENLLFTLLYDLGRVDYRSG